MARCQRRQVRTPFVTHARFSVIIPSVLQPFWLSPPLQMIGLNRVIQDTARHALWCPRFSKRAEWHDFARMTVKKGYRVCVREIRPTSFDQSPTQKNELFFSACQAGVQVLMLKDNRFTCTSTWRACCPCIALLERETQRRVRTTGDRMTHAKPTTGNPSRTCPPNGSD
jgi:hypothetical protein